MDKQRTKELLRELAEREFSIEECIVLFTEVEYFMEMREQLANNTNPLLEKHCAIQFERSRKVLEDILAIDGLEYEPMDFVNE